jgi:hypothetical protein
MQRHPRAWVTIAALALLAALILCACSATSGAGSASGGGSTPTPPTPPPANALSGWASATAFNVTASDGEIHVFAHSSLAGLYDNHWDGRQWTLEGRGSPTPGGAIGDPAAIHWYDEVRAFVRGSDGALYDAHRTGCCALNTPALQWSWEPLGPPPNATIAVASAPAVIGYEGAFSANTLHAEMLVFVRGANGHLYVDSWQGGLGNTKWTWADLGMPPGTTVASAAGATFYAIYGQGGTTRIYAFVQGANGHLYVEYWDGAQWNWADQGTPAQASVVGRPAVIVSPFHGFARLYAFVRGSDGHLYVNFWDGAQWNWADQGVPPSTTVGGDPGVVGYSGVYGPEGLYAFVRGSNGHLDVDYWNGARWTWADQAVPPNVIVGGDPGPVVGRFAGTNRLYAFATGSDGHLYVDFWDTANWLWADQGAPA